MGIRERRTRRLAGDGNARPLRVWWVWVWGWTGGLEERRASLVGRESLDLRDCSPSERGEGGEEKSQSRIGGGGKKAGQHCALALNANPNSLRCSLPAT